MRETVSVIERLSRNPLVYQEQRCITLSLMDEAHERPAGTARRAFRQHRDKLVLGRHFFDVPYVQWSQLVVQMDEFRPSENKNHNNLILLTERGYLLVVKSFQDDLAWKVQEALVDGYFALREHARKTASGMDDQLAAVLVKLLGQQTAILDRFTRMDEQRRECPPTRQLVGVRDRICEMLGDTVTTRRQKDMIMRRVLGRCFLSQFHTEQLTRGGPHLLDRCYIAIVDNEVDRFKREMRGKLEPSLPFPAEGRR